MREQLTERPQADHGRFSRLEVAMLPPGPGSAVWHSPFRVFDERRFVTLRYLVWYQPGGCEIVIPAGFESDGPSIPAIFEPILPSRLRIMEAGVLHDWLCRVGHIANSFADAQFRQALLALGINGFWATVLYLGLRIASPWRRNERWSWANLASAIKLKLRLR